VIKILLSLFQQAPVIAWSARVVEGVVQTSVCLDNERHNPPYFFRSAEVCLNERSAPTVSDDLEEQGPSFAAPPSCDDDSGA
jgi:hypothetical protein